MAKTIKQIIIALATEGSSDHRFLPNIIQRTFERVACEDQQEIEIFEPICLSQISGENIREKAKKYAIQAVEKGAMVLCFHADADDKTDENAFNERINPAFNAIKSDKGDLCNNLVAIVPIQMTEAWMLADKELLKKQLCTKKSDSELAIDKHPESFSNPKETIKNAINKAREGIAKRYRNKLKIDDLYSPLATIELSKLESLSSYKKFEEAVRDIFPQLTKVSNIEDNPDQT
ncbi:MULTISPECIES: DUF4276 family protein [unclassified Microcystis]|uniref:DUF4276 family protein n=1 Tax=unclassified Microcystis TaxID=2643300 RepID=UPI001194E55C|nr:MULTISPECIES: DUF4276 family protein [unclassified Microcystis]MCA2928048.1 DUF4276 family protein [Microcystis sp. M020S1]MCA2937183.1 DUF4276 family protein [Microcystis sp. M015S1]MCA2620925.1 DUF4276 family protein [Microcystis sp. M099S2]MCA2652345.1 DUF4276 family protein [Microcystis sp. M065S2]MCA2681202.1 DUF4276 family protein [Microcystis sp. M043S2]